MHPNYAHESKVLNTNPVPVYGIDIMGDKPLDPQYHWIKYKNEYHKSSSTNIELQILITVSGQTSKCQSTSI